MNTKSTFGIVLLVIAIILFLIWLLPFPSDEDRSPVINSFAPISGASGTEVTIQGKNFIEITQVSFNLVAGNFDVISENEIKAKVPNGATTGKISMKNSFGMASSKDEFFVVTIDSFDVVKRDIKNEDFILSDMGAAIHNGNLTLWKAVTGEDGHAEIEVDLADYFSIELNARVRGKTNKAQLDISSKVFSISDTLKEFKTEMLRLDSNRVSLFFRGEFGENVDVSNLRLSLFKRIH